MESLDESDDGRKYNQFEGRKSTYHENLYTTRLDESQLTEEQKRTGQKLEREILGQVTEGNIHLAEERNQLDQHDVDETQRYANEEMRYSGVYRKEEDFHKS